MSQATDLQNRLIEAIQAKYPKSRLWRTNVGTGVPLGTYQKALPFLLKGIVPPWIRTIVFGVEGSGDISGWIHIDGVAVAAHVEVKIGNDRQSESQIIFERVIKSCGGIYAIAEDLDQGMRDLETAVAAARAAHSLRERR